MFERDPSLPASWGSLQPLLEACTHAELTSSVLVKKGEPVRNVFSVLTLTRQSAAPLETPRFEYLSEPPPKTVPDTAFQLAVARTTCASRDALCAVPWQGKFVEPAKKAAVVCEGDWAEPVFCGSESTRMGRLLPDVDRAFWGLCCVPRGDFLRVLVGERAEAWVLDQVGKAIGRSLVSVPEYATGFIVVLPEYRARLTVQRGDHGRLGIEYHHDLGQVRPIAYARSTRNDEFCNATAVELKDSLTVLEMGASDYDEVELHDLHSGMILDRHAGVPLRGGTLALNQGEPIVFDVALRDGDGNPGAPIQVKTHWGHFQHAGWGQQNDWEMNQRRAVILAEQRRLQQDGRLFFYSGQPGERTKALADIRQLIRRHARTRVWVWDPYFGGRDAVEFLPYVGDPTIPVKVLTSLSTPVGESDLPHVVARAQLLEAAKALALPRDNGPGMTDITIKVGTGFHDRFLITDARCWQLGCSFNQIGKVYSTIVEFPYAELVVKAFEHEWNLKKTKLLKDVED